MESAQYHVPRLQSGSSHKQTGYDVSVKWQPALWPCLLAGHHLIVNKFSSL